jgi:hypothetical protein
MVVGQLEISAPLPADSLVYRTLAVLQEGRVFFKVKLHRRLIFNPHPGEPASVLILVF